jgi:SLOG cluster2/TIR domain
METIPSVYRPFLNLYVIWHPDFQDGQTYAEKLYREFSRDSDHPMSPDLGIPIYFRTSSANGVAPAPIELGQATYNVVLFLVESSMVLDDVYQDYAQQIGAASTAVKFQTVILAFKWPQSGNLKLGNLQQILLPADEKEALRTMRMKLAAETCRLLQQQPRSGDGIPFRPEPPRVFLSHAKRDGEDKALLLKALIETTAIDTFFDKADIAAGYNFDEELLGNIKRSAIIAWQSDEYASRPWCNIELLKAKEFLRPIVVVLGIKSGEERSFPYLGNVRTIVATEANLPEILIAAVREYLRKLYTEGRFASLIAAGLLPHARYQLFRQPELIDGALFERKTQQENASAPNDELQSRDQVLYPDPPLSTTELDLLHRLFPDLEFLTPACPNVSSFGKLKVGISISEAEDLLTFGLSQAHLASAMVEIARHILCRGGIIAYGGDLRRTDPHNFTRKLFQLVHAYQDAHRTPVERIWNFLAYQVAEAISKQEEAGLLELAKFVKPLPQNLKDYFHLQPGKRQALEHDTPEHRYIRARCLTAMREAMTQEINARIVIGGKVTGHTGKYPGILEEAYLMLCACKPLYLIGAFGGCTRLLIQALRDKQRPEGLTRAYQVRHPLLAKYPGPDGSMKEELVPYEELETSYLKYENDPVIGEGPIDYDKLVDMFLNATIVDLNNGLTEEENLELFVTSDLDRIIFLLVRGLKEVQSRM